MTKENLRKYIEKHGDAEAVLKEVKSMMAEGVEITEEALDERLKKDEFDFSDLPDFEEVTEVEEPTIVEKVESVEEEEVVEPPKERPVYKYIPPEENITMRDSDGEIIEVDEDDDMQGELEPVDYEEPFDDDDVPPKKPSSKSKLLLPITIASAISYAMVVIGYMFSQWEFVQTSTGVSLAMTRVNPLALIGAPIVSILSVVVMWMIFVKAGKPGWKSIVPLYNLWVLTQMVYGKGSKVFLILIPFYNIYWIIKLYINLGRVFGKKGGFLVGMVFLSPVFLSILAFDDSEYQGAIIKKK